MWLTESYNPCVFGFSDKKPENEFARVTPISSDATEIDTPTREDS